MKRKSPKIAEEVQKAEERLLEVQKLAEEAKEEEEKFLNQAQERVKALAEELGMFVGAVITIEDIMGILKLMISSGQRQVDIPARAYFKE